MRSWVGGTPRRGVPRPVDEAHDLHTHPPAGSFEAARDAHFRCAFSLRLSAQNLGFYECTWGDALFKRQGPASSPELDCEHEGDNINAKKTKTKKNTKKRGSGGGRTLDRNGRQVNTSFRYTWLVLVTYLRYGFNSRML